MDVNILKSILQEMVNNEWTSFVNVPEPNFSRRHNRKMNRIFNLYEKNTIELRSINSYEPQKRIKLTRRTIQLILVAVFLATLAGCAIAYYVSQNFRGEIFATHTELTLVNIDDAPLNIEQVYYISELPDNFEIVEEVSSPFHRCIIYKNASTDQEIVFDQRVKTKSYSINYNTENHDIEEVIINDRVGLCLDLSDNEHDYCGVIWDNGDYIIKISGNLPKTELMVLAKCTKIENYS